MTPSFLADAQLEQCGGTTERQKDGHTDTHADRQKDRRTNGQTDGGTKICEGTTMKYDEDGANEGLGIMLIMS